MFLSVQKGYWKKCFSSKKWKKEIMTLKSVMMGTPPTSSEIGLHNVSLHLKNIEVKSGENR